MKKQKLKRRTYRPVSKKVKTVKKIVWRILFVLICAVALAVSSVYLGAWLKERAGHIDGILSTDTQQTEIVPSETLPPTKVEPVEKQDVMAAHLDVLVMTAAEIEEYIYNLHESYNTVSINITAEDGKLVYVSPALLEYVKLDPSDITATHVGENATNDEDTSYADVLANIKTALAAAKRKELRTCAVYSASSAVMQSEAYEGAWEIDCVILRELYELGFDEVLVDGLFTEDMPFSIESVNRASAYAVDLKSKVTEIGLGLVLPESALFVSANASMVNTLSEYADFLGVYISGEGADAEEAYSVAYEEFHSVKGMLTAYNVRTVILDEDEDVAAAVATALTDLASVSVQFANEIVSPIYSIETEEDTTETDPSESAYNENANRKDNYTNDTEAEEGASDVVTDATV